MKFFNEIYLIIILNSELIREFI